jgi:hypothetical protein
MTIWKWKRSWAPMAVLILVLLNTPCRAKEVYKWVDEKGTVHFSEDESSVPEKYRDQLEKRSMSEESKSSKEERVKVTKQDGKAAKDRQAVKEKEGINRNKIEGDVTESVKRVLSLWKEGKYGLLYDEYGDQKSRISVNREKFEQRMTERGLKLASSWETIRDIKVEVKSATLAYATVKMGYKPSKGGDTKFRTETYRMSLEKGAWKISLTKILSAK